MIIKAREFALLAHGNQKYGDFPYSYHLDAVAKLALPYGDVAQMIAYLHDVVEDTDVEILEIDDQFGSLVANCVSVLTDEPGKDRKERKQKTYAKMSAVQGDTELALIVKAADRLANVKACIRFQSTRKLRMYHEEHAVFFAAAYRQGQCEDLWLQLNQLLKI